MGMNSVRKIESASVIACVIVESFPLDETVISALSVLLSNCKAPGTSAVLVAVSPSRFEGD